MTSKNEPDDSSIAEKIAKLPGQAHLNRIKNALENGHAVVMVGSGFSFNAERGNKLPSWTSLIDGLLNDLYSPGELRNRAKEKIGGISGMLRLAEEYAAVLGRARLDVRMHELLPDIGVTTPGALHTELLSLPWVDVFTTNYDTLWPPRIT